ncbi:MAG: ATP-binding protein [Pseudomonadota bacterium]
MTGDLSSNLADRPDALQALQSHIESILDSVPDAMVVMDESGRILSFSAAATELFGYAPDEVVGQDVGLLMTYEDAPHHHEYVKRYMETGERRIIGIGRVVRAKNKAGDSFPVDLKIGAAKVGGGYLFTAFMRDLSETQRAQLRLQSLQADLENFTRLSAVGTMASAMAHELNQPLTAVANYLEAARDLLNEPDDETVAIVRDALTEAAKQSVRAGDLIRRLRDYVSRGEVDTRAVSLVDTLRDSISLLKVRDSGEGARIVYDAPSSLALVQIDPVQVQQVVVNLCRNAIEAARPGEAAEVRIEARQTDGGFAEVSVTDNGPGIDPENAESLFKPFSSSKATGMGLGLSICRTIVEAHGGRIGAESLEAGGARFYFTLPLAVGEPATEGL